MKIGLIGTYDVNNFGDCMFPELYAHLLAERLGDVSLTLYSPRPHPAEILSFERVAPLPARLEAARFDEDALILTGGEMVGLGHGSGTYILPDDTLSAYLRLWLAPAVAAARPGGPRFAAHCIGARKMAGEVNALAARALGGASVRFRDAFSQAWIRDGETGFGRAVDPMFLIDRLMPAEAWRARASALLPDGLPPEGYVVAQTTPGYIQGRFPAWVDGVAAIAQRTGLPVLLLPICHFLHDRVVLERAAARLAAAGIPHRLLGERVNVKDTAALIGASAGYCGTSLHGAVTAVAFGLPLAVLAHAMDGKHEGTLRSVGVRGAVTTEPAGLPGCFAATEGLDRPAIRRAAQAAAEAGMDALLDDLKAPARAQPDALAAAERLVALEQEMLRTNPSLRLKRAVFRQLARFEPAERAYHGWRIRSRLNRAAARAG